MNSYQFYYGAENAYVDVTDLVETKCTTIDDPLIKISGKYNSLFGDPKLGALKHLKIYHDLFGSIYVKENMPLIFAKQPDPLPRINIVYFINTYCSQHYVHLLRGQLKKLKETNLVEETKANFFIEICADTINQNISKEVANELFPNATITMHHESNHEYFGIKRVWDLSQQNPDNYTLYFHSKGITRLKNSARLTWEEDDSRKLFAKVIADWKYNLTILSLIQSIHKLGLTGHKSGHVWYNFWWVRGSYLKGLPEPVHTQDRFYYEHWLKMHEAWNKVDHSVGCTHHVHLVDFNAHPDESACTHHQHIFNKDLIVGQQRFNIGTYFDNYRWQFFT